ncbi:imm11 family protein [Bordetella genomosp. 4]|uniref:imm11 family protein n=1 Tax=Bordetella genomosp. 4 TaxID=463044 RepID=UPI0034E892F7
MHDGSPAPRYYLGNALRRLDALDEAASRVRIKLDHNDQTGKDEKLYSLVGGASLVFKQDVVGDAHIFRQDRMGAPPVCDRAMFDARRGVLSCWLYHIWTARSRM